MVEFRDYKDRLTWAMKEAGVTVTMLAAHLGISYQGVKKVADGKSSAFSAANNETAAAYLKINSRWLATGKGPIRPADEKNEPLSFQSAERIAPFGVRDKEAPYVKAGFLHEDAWIAEAIRTLQELSEQDRRAAVLNLRVFVATLDKPDHGQALPVAA
jgi:hypothetical protein